MSQKSLLHATRSIVILYSAIIVAGLSLGCQHLSTRGWWRCTCIYSTSVFRIRVCLKGRIRIRFFFKFNLSDPENYAVKEKLIKVKKHIFKVKINFFFRINQDMDQYFSQLLDPNPHTNGSESIRKNKAEPQHCTKIFQVLLTVSRSNE